MKYSLFILFALFATSAAAQPGLYFDSNLKTLSEKSVMIEENKWQVHPPVQWQTLWHVKQRLPSSVPEKTIRKTEVKKPTKQSGYSSPITCEMSVTSARHKPVLKYSCNSLQAIKAVENLTLAVN